MPNGMHGSLTYGQVEAHADAFAVYLRQGLKLAAGARVALQTPNCLAYPVAAFGILKAGCVLVNTNPLYTPTEMEHQLRDSGAEAVVIIDMFADKLMGLLARTKVKQVIVVEVSQFFSPVPRAVIRGVMRWWNRVLPPLQIKHVRLPQALAEGAALQRRHKIDPASYTRDVGPEALAVWSYGVKSQHCSLRVEIEPLAVWVTSDSRAGPDHGTEFHGPEILIRTVLGQVLHEHIHSP